MNQSGRRIDYSPKTIDIIHIMILDDWRISEREVAVDLGISPKHVLYVLPLYWDMEMLEVQLLKIGNMPKHLTTSKQRLVKLGFVHFIIAFNICMS